MLNASAFCNRNDHTFPAIGDKPLKVAVLTDFENLHAARFDQTHGKGAYGRSETRGERILDLGELTTLVEKSVGPIAVQLAFLPFNFRYKAYREDMIKNLVTPVPVITSRGAKNGVDMALACHAIKLAYTDPSVTHFVLASMDLDFAVLAKVLREMGKIVVGLGIEEVEINPMWISSCNAFLYLPTKQPRCQESEESSDRPKDNKQKCPGHARLQKVSYWPREMRAKVEEYQQILEKHQIRLPTPSFRRTVFEAIADHFANHAEVWSKADGSCRGLEGLIKQVMGSSGIELTAREVFDLRQLFQQCRLVRNEHGRWKLVVDPCLDAMDYELGRAVLEFIGTARAPSLDAVRILLFGRPNSPAGEFLKDLHWLFSLRVRTPIVRRPHDLAEQGCQEATTLK
jgi:hypothetical protein